MSFWNASILMAFNYTLLICVFRISNSSNRLEWQKIIMNSFRNYNEISL